MSLATTQSTERNARVAMDAAIHQSMKIEAAKEGRPIQSLYDDASTLYLSMKRGDISIIHREARDTTSGK